MRDRLYKRAVGLLVVCSLVLVLVLMRSYQHAERFLGRTFALHALVNHVHGLERDAQVTMAGLKVGKVHDIELLPDKRARITLNVELRYQHLLRADSLATLTKPLIGGAMVDISIGTASQAPLPDEGMITLLVRPDLTDVLADLPARLQRVDQVLVNLVATTDAARGAVQRLATPHGALDSTLADAAASARNVRLATETLKTVMADVHSVAASSQLAVGQVQGVLADVRGLTAQSAGMAGTLQRTLGHVEEFSSGLRMLVPQLSPTVQAAQNAAEDADKVLRAASNSFLLGGPRPAPAAPLLISPRAP
jgi:phospholipid/cholesterol/gamma-HCH transport system substrate-binding protein